MSVLIIVKGTSEAGGALAHYDPPIADLSVCAWLGSPDPVSMRNFGTMGELSVVGAPAVVNSIWRRVNLTNYYVLPEYLRSTLTMFAIYRDVAPLNAASSDNSNIITSERNAGDGGRRGAGLGVVYNATPATNRTLTATAFGTSAGAAASNICGTSFSDAVPMLAFAEFSPNAGGGIQCRIQRYTAAGAYPAAVTSTNTTYGPDTDEASFPLRVGANYRGTWGKNVDVAVVGTVRRVLSTAEKAALATSLGQRMTAFGVTI